MPLQNHHIRTIKTIVLLLGALTPLYVGSLQWNGSVRSEMIPLVIWLLSPYVCLFIVTTLLERFSGIKGIFGINCGVAVLILALSIWAYSIALDETSDTGHLIFFFGPIWVYLAGFISLGSTLLFVKLAAR